MTKQGMFVSHKCGMALSLVLLSATLTGCGLFLKKGDNPQDPYEAYNRKVFKFNRSVDRVLLKPVAKTYRGIIPAFIRKGVHNFFSNVFEIHVFLNDVIQFRLEDAMRTAWRFGVNSTVGVGGLFDVAKDAGLPHRENDLGATFYHWGWRESQYTVTPIFGPGTSRDALGFTIEDFLLTPYRFIDDRTLRLSLSFVERVSHRSQLLQAEPALDTALDPYIMVRNAYFQKRNKLLKGGNEKESPKAREDDLQPTEMEADDDPYIEE